ncbi:hypothetical protein ISCGN_022019 [Ixodes scapularis]
MMGPEEGEEVCVAAEGGRGRNRFPEKWLFDAPCYQILALQIRDRALNGFVVELPGFVSVDEAATVLDKAVRQDTAARRDFFIFSVPVAEDGIHGSGEISDPHTHNKHADDTEGPQTTSRPTSHPTGEREPRSATGPGSEGCPQPRVGAAASPSDGHPPLEAERELARPGRAHGKTETETRLLGRGDRTGRPRSAASERALTDWWEKVHAMMGPEEGEEVCVAAEGGRGRNRFPEKWLFDAPCYQIVALQIRDRALNGFVVELPGFVSVDEAATVLDKAVRQDTAARRDFFIFSVPRREWFQQPHDARKRLLERTPHTTTPRSPPTERPRTCSSWEKAFGRAGFLNLAD